MFDGIPRPLDVLIAMFAFFVKGIVSLGNAVIPLPPVWAVEGFDALGILWSYMSALDTWIPINLAVACALTVITVYGAVLVLGTIRLVASYFTLGGGAT